MIISDIMGISTVCSKATAANTGSYSCPFQFQLPDGPILVKKGYRIPAGTDVTAAFLLGLVQQGLATPILDAFNFEPNTEDDVKETSNTGVSALARRGLTTLMFTYKKGIDHEKALEKLLSFGAFDVWIVDKASNILGVDKTGDFGAFAAGLVLPKARTWNDGSSAEGKSIEIQLTSPGEFAKMTWIEAGSLPIFLPTEFQGKNGVIIKFEDANGAVVPSDTDTTVKVRLLAIDGVTPIIGAATGQIRSTSNAISAVVDDGSGYYTLTLAALVAAATLDIELYDGTANQDSIIVGGFIFTGSTTTVVAP